MPGTLEKALLLEVSNPLAARILANPEVALFLKPFMRGPTTVKAAAQEFKLPLQAMHYRVLQMLRAGLLEVVGVKPRQGRAIKHYQATALAFQVPLGLIPHNLLESLTDHVSWKSQLERGLARALGGRGFQGQMVVYLSKDGLLTWGSSLYDWEEGAVLLAPEHPAVLNLWIGGLALSRADAKALQRELWELYERYAHRGGAEKYVLHLGLAPAP
ncbi:winged helix-turn-helix domain-containing protein [Meiothermus rufus]|uniref:winged helix-turn-helix domain-containing protein n=1 Tax=Meiothermus rufus TaxID=604332 RepID=UPI0003FD554C|nr:helix-turn-helix domain-containing protein [Meiothermus rufus]